MSKRSIKELKRNNKELKRNNDESKIGDGKALEFEVQDFDPVHIFECGQCFRWERVWPNGNAEDAKRNAKKTTCTYVGIARDRVAKILFEPAGKDRGILKIHEAQTVCSNTPARKESRKFWHTYFDLDRNYDNIKRTLKRRDTSGVMKKVIPSGSGIRILRQDPWETTVSFLISQNNNIPRIKKNICDLANAFGEPAGSISLDISGSANNSEMMLCSLPSPAKLASLSEASLAPIKLGYRARYLIETARCVCKKGIDILTEDLDSLCGVGPKVANCIRLFGLGQTDSFPIDVWVKRVMTELYGLEDPADMAHFAKQTFGEYGGIAQQYLFYYMRENSR